MANCHDNSTNSHNNSGTEKVYSAADKLRVLIFKKGGYIDRKLHMRTNKASVSSDVSYLPGDDDKQIVSDTSQEDGDRLPHDDANDDVRDDALDVQKTEDDTKDKDGQVDQAEHPATQSVLRESTTEMKVQERKLKLQSKSRNNANGGISFADLLKFRHGSNTKKLFALVDRLAEQNGLKNILVSPAAMSQSIDPRDNVARKRREKHNDDTVDLSHPTIVKFASMFYSMKFGYNFLSAIRKPKDTCGVNEDDRDRDPFTPAQPVGQSVDASSSSYDISSKPSTRQIIPTTNTTTNTPLAETETSVGVSIVNFHSAAHLGVKPSFSSRRLSKAVSDDSRRTSVYSTINEIPDKTNIQQSPKIGLDSKRRNSRRTSILEASNFISQRRASQMIQHQGLPGFLPVPDQRGRDAAHHQHQHRDKVGRTHQPLMHVQRAEEKIVPWPSALGQIKLIHSLDPVHMTTCEECRVRHR